MRSRPADLTVRYEWCGATMPPPYHHEYTIHIGPGCSGEIVFVPDYSMHDPPVWVEKLDVAEKDLDEMYALMVKKGVFDKRWTEIQNPPIGGSLEWLEVTALGERFSVPSAIVESKTIKEIYQAIKSLVPDATWSKLRSRREEYMHNYLEGQE